MTPRPMLHRTQRRAERALVRDPGDPRRPLGRTAPCGDSLPLLSNCGSRPHDVPGHGDAERRAWPRRRAVRLCSSGCRILTTIVTTIELCPGRFATVRHRSVCRLTCADGLRRTAADPWPTAGGQGVAGSEPVSPTLEPTSGTGRPDRLCRGFGEVAASMVPTTRMPR